MREQNLPEDTWEHVGILEWIFVHRQRTQSLCRNKMHRIPLPYNTTMITPAAWVHVTPANNALFGTLGCNQKAAHIEGAIRLLAITIKICAPGLACTCPSLASTAAQSVMVGVLVLHAPRSDDWRVAKGAMRIEIKCCFDLGLTDQCSQRTNKTAKVIKSWQQSSSKFWTEISEHNRLSVSNLGVIFSMQLAIVCFSSLNYRAMEERWTLLHTSFTS